MQTQFKENVHRWNRWQDNHRVWPLTTISNQPTGWKLWLWNYRNEKLTSDHCGPLSPTLPLQTLENGKPQSSGPPLASEAQLQPASVFHHATSAQPGHYTSFISLETANWLLTHLMFFGNPEHELLTAGWWGHDEQSMHDDDENDDDYDDDNDDDNPMMIIRWW